MSWAAVSICFATFIWVEKAQAAVNDLLPNDFYALPAGTTSAATYLFDRHQTGTYVNGRQLGEFKIDSTIGAVRLSHTTVAGGWKLGPVMVVSAADIALSGSSAPASVDHRRAGLGDLRIGGTLWFIDQPAARHFLALNLMTLWPTGDYDRRELANAGENRRRHALTLGWIRGLTDNLTLELAPELAWYGSNKESFPGTVEIRQARTLSLTGYLRYRFTSNWQGFVGGQLNEGGETHLNGIAQDNPIEGRRLYLGAIHALDSSNSLNLRYASDTSVRTGLKMTRELLLRWVHNF